ncbi:MAG TPA: NADH-quinone oxidoreductase subunit C [Myxococcales bacterium]|nr:NADH-quinone oxidoreductase subunit C [Myxococcales bacterium]
MNGAQLKEHIERTWPGQASCRLDAEARVNEVTCEPGALAALCGDLFHERGLAFGGLVVEEGREDWQLRYVFYGARDSGWVHVRVTAPLAQSVFPSIAAQAKVFAADWHEREAEDLFGVHFEGHPRLGDFVLHDDVWQEDVQPMRRGFDAATAMNNRLPDADWRPRRVVHESGAFMMPVGPKFSGVTESVHFQLETVGEDVIRSWTRLFYKWRAVEKLAEGKPLEDALLLAERFAATTAFAHGLAFCQAIESIAGASVPARAQTLRVFLAELERLRQHAGAIQEICESTALVVATSQAGLLEEELLRVSGALAGHRYLFGLLAPGGLAADLPGDACRKALAQAAGAVARLDELEGELAISSSFLDRIEEVGVIFPRTAVAYSLVGPVARASNLARDLRRMQPYSRYDAFAFDVPVEEEGDGYARLRVLFAEARQSLRIMQQAAADLEAGEVRAAVTPRPGAALGWAEAPRGATLHWVRLDDAGRVARYRIVTPSFTNWHSFHLAAEKFAFQDFPIILSTFDLSAAENDR